MDVDVLIALSVGVGVGVGCAKLGSAIAGGSDGAPAMDAATPPDPERFVRVPDGKVDAALESGWRRFVARMGWKGNDGAEGGAGSGEGDGGSDAEGVVAADGQGGDVVDGQGWRSVSTIPIGVAVRVKSVRGIECVARAVGIGGTRWIRRAGRGMPERIYCRRLDLESGTIGDVAAVGWKPIEDSPVDGVGE